MKLAKQIVKEARMPWHREWEGNRIPPPLIIIPEDMIEDIIAAKLMPVRDAIQFVLNDSKEEWSGTMLTNKTDKALCEILDMLSDEEK